MASQVSQGDGHKKSFKQALAVNRSQAQQQRQQRQGQYQNGHSQMNVRYQDLHENNPYNRTRSMNSPGVNSNAGIYPIISYNHQNQNLNSNHNSNHNHNHNHTHMYTNYNGNNYSGYGNRNGYNGGFRRHSKSQMSPMMRNNNGHNNNNNKGKKTKSRIRQKRNNNNQNNNNSQQNSRRNNNNNNNNDRNNNMNNNNNREKEQQQNKNTKTQGKKKKNQRNVKQGIKMKDLGYESDDSVIDAIFERPNRPLEDEDDLKLDALDDSIEDCNGIQSKKKKTEKDNINRRDLNFDIATKGWYDKKDPQYKIKKFMNDLFKSERRKRERGGQDELPKLIIKNVEAVNWGYGDVFGALDEFIEDMKRMGNKIWGELTDDDINDYRVNIPTQFMPKRKEEKEVQNEKENKDENDGDDIDIVDQNKMDSVENLEEIRKKYQEWLQNRSKEVNDSKFKSPTSFTEDPWYDPDRIETFFDLLVRHSAWCPKSFKTKIKLFNELNIVDKMKSDSNDEYNYGYIRKNYKLKMVTVLSDTGEINLLQNIDKYHHQKVPKINSKNIIRKNKKVRHYPDIIATKDKFIKPNYGYNEYIFSQQKKQYVRDPKTNQRALKDIPYIEFTLNPSGDFIRKNRDWAKKMATNIEKYNGKAFGSNIKLGFFESFKMFHLYMDVPHQVLKGQNWNGQVADLVRDGLNQVNSNAFDYRNILAIRKWGGRFTRRVSIYVCGQLPRQLPKQFKWGCGQQIQLRVYHDDINVTAKRAMNLPKCRNCFEIGHDSRDCPDYRSARAVYARQVYANYNIPYWQKKELIRKFKYEPNKCTKCGKTGHNKVQHRGGDYCSFCHCDTHCSGYKNVNCTYLMKYAITTLRFDYFYQKCINYCHDIPPVPAIGQNFEYNIPWTFSHEFDRENHILVEIQDWEQQWLELKQKGNGSIVDKVEKKGNKNRHGKNRNNNNHNNNNNNNNNVNDSVVRSIGRMNGDSDSESELDDSMNGMGLNSNLNDKFNKAVQEHKVKMQQLENEYNEKCRALENEMSGNRMKLEKQIQKDQSSHNNKMKQLENESRMAKNEIRKLEIEKEKQQQKLGEKKEELEKLNAQIRLATKKRKGNDGILDDNSQESERKRHRISNGGGGGRDRRDKSRSDRDRHHSRDGNRERDRVDARSKANARTNQNNAALGNTQHIGVADVSMTGVMPQPSQYVNRQASTHTSAINRNQAHLVSNNSNRYNNGQNNQGGNSSNSNSNNNRSHGHSGHSQHSSRDTRHR